MVEFGAFGPMKFGALGRRNSGHEGDEMRVLGTRILDGKHGADFGGRRVGLLVSSGSGGCGFLRW